MGIERLSVVGSGIMGAGVASARRRLGSRSCCGLASRSRRTPCWPLWEFHWPARSSGGGWTKPKPRVSARVSATEDLDALADCDLVLESVVEDLEVKETSSSTSTAWCPSWAILATNTSTLPVVELAVETSRPERSWASTSSTRPPP